MSLPPSSTIRASAFITSWTPRLQTLRRSYATSQTIFQTRHYSTRTTRTTTKMQSDTNGVPPTLSTIVPTDLGHEMKRSYLEYALSVILGRAMPDVRDGLKPVHRRIIFAMHELGLLPNSPFRKSARVVGEVLGKYHPHGDSAVYDALVRMAQPFSMSIPLINGHGNFGSTDGDPAAAMRYTECKLAKITYDTFLDGLEKDTVSFGENFDGSEQEPLVLPVKVPNLLVNGSSGIAVGMATNIPPHNLKEVVMALVELIDNPQVDDETLMKLIPAPDFPTGGEILGTEGAKEMYTTGKGRVVVRASAHKEVLHGGKRKLNRDAIIVTELPFQVNKAVLVAKIAELVNDKKLDGIVDLRDESDRNGTRIVIELKRDSQVDVVLNNLYKKTQLQSSFAANVMALDNGRFPLRLSLRQCLEKFLQFRRETVRRRLRYELNKAQQRLHIVKGLLTVQLKIDDIVKDIRNAENISIARKSIMEGYGLSEIQANSVLEMQLRRLTSLEYNRLQQEDDHLTKELETLQEILGNASKLDSVIRKELIDTASKHGTARRSKILLDVIGSEELDELSLTCNERSAIMVTKQGYIKRVPTSAFESQNRGTRGKRGVGRLRDGDRISDVFSCMSHDSLVAISTSGIAYSLPAHKVPESALGSRGVPIFQLLPGVEAGQTMAAVVVITKEESEMFLSMVTKKGYVKKIQMKNLLSINSRGKIVVALDEEDELCWVKKCKLEDWMIIGSKNGQVIRFQTDEKQLRASGRTSRGVKSIRLSEGDAIADMDVINEENGCMLLVTEKGVGKRVYMNAFKTQQRAGMGVRGIGLKRNDRVVAMQSCHEEQTVMLVTSSGTVVRTKVDEIPVQSRYARGVVLQRLGQRDKVAAVAIVKAEEELPLDL